MMYLPCFLREALGGSEGSGGGLLEAGRCNNAKRLRERQTYYGGEPSPLRPWGTGQAKTRRRLRGEPTSLRPRENRAGRATPQIAGEAVTRHWTWKGRLATTLPGRFRFHQQRHDGSYALALIAVVNIFSRSCNAPLYPM